jgi:hypothetical protein
MLVTNLLFNICGEIKKILTKITDFHSLPPTCHLSQTSTQVGLLSPAYSIGWWEMLHLIQQQ